jgi:hypothetical protein
MHKLLRFCLLFHYNLLIAFQFQHNSDAVSRFSVCCRSRGSKLLYPVLNNVVISNRSMSLSVKMSSEYLLRWYHSRYYLKTSVRRTHGVQPIADPCLLNGVRS